LQLKAQPPASKQNIKNVKNWLFNNNGPIYEKEAEFVDKEDLITIAAGRKSSARYLFERMILVPTNGLFGLFTRRDHTNLSDCRTIVQGKDEHIDALATAAIFLAAAMMLIAPLWILAGIGETYQKLTVITIFLIVFLSVLNWGTVARPFEILAATAG
jgi:hypothetical protein